MLQEDLSHNPFRLGGPFSSAKDMPPKDDRYRFPLGRMTSLKKSAQNGLYVSRSQCQERRKIAPMKRRITFYSL